MVKPVVLVMATAAAVAVIALARREAVPAGGATLTGTVEAREIVVASELAGRVTVVHVEEGARVAAGDPLFELDDAELRLDVAELEARRATALAEVAALAAGPQRPSVRSQRSRMREAEVAVAQAERELGRARALSARNAAPAADADLAELGVRSARQRLETERQGLALIEAGAPAPDIAVAERRAAELEPRLARARLRVTRAHVVAPGPGVVARREIEPGELIAAGGPAYVIVDTSRLWVELTVDEATHAGLELGAAVTVRAEGSDLPPLRGRVSYIGDRHAFTPRSIDTPADRALLTYRVKVELAAPPAAIKPGMFVTVRP